MTSHVRPTPMTDPLYDYFLSVSLREPDLLRRLREETAMLSHGDWQTAPEQGPLLDLLVKMLPAKRCQRGIHRHCETLLGRSGCR